jgi:hypothetical protein
MKGTEIIPLPSWQQFVAVAVLAFGLCSCQPPAIEKHAGAPTLSDKPSEAPAPNRRPRFPLGALGELVYLFSASPASPAAAGEARR